MNTKSVLIFPYSGYAEGSERGKLFWQMVKCCQDTAGDKRPIVVLNMDTVNQENAQAYLKAERSKEVETIKVWSVDTCQMWLAGWGYVLDKYDVTRIVQLPGDIDKVQNSSAFFNNLRGFITQSEWDIVIGDFSTGGEFNAKELIDYYGTYALLANWFPEITQKILHLPLSRPRSEFLNIRVTTLRQLLKYRKFAYEQTLNLLIHSWNFSSSKWNYTIYPHLLGELIDDSSFRVYSECLDQIERTERMLKLLWREVHQRGEGCVNTARQKEFIDQYHVLDQRSTSIRENSRIIIGSMLDV